MFPSVSSEMKEREEAGTAATITTIEDAKRRCIALRNRLHGMSPSKIPSANLTLFRLIDSELAFLHRLSNHPSSPPPPLSLNIGHLEAVTHVLLQPFVTAVSRICKSVRLSPAHSIYVDIVCSVAGHPAWLIVSDRNPKFITWDGIKGIQMKIQKVVYAAQQSPLTLRPLSIVLFFSNGLVDNVYQKLEYEFGGIKLEMEPFSYEELDLEDGWTDLVIGRSFHDACVVKIGVDQESQGMENFNHDSTSISGTLPCKKGDGFRDINLAISLRSLVSGMKCWCCTFASGLLKHPLRDVEVKVNFDTTAMVAIVSGISNGKTDKLLATSESELRGRFKGNFDFVIAQVQSENQNPIHKELSSVLSGKLGIICESVFSEFQELVSMCGGPNEKLRAEYFLKFLKVVPDCPSTRLMSLPTTRKLALKNKVVFGTGDHWNAPTITANMAFVRAVTQTGMSLSIIEHRPRALIGD